LLSASDSGSFLRVAKRENAEHRSGCPLSISLEILGDRWSFLIIRDLMVRGFQNFRDFERAGEGIATNILADRLRRLQRSGIVETELDPTDRRRINYRLTEKGIDLAPVLFDLLVWGANHEKTGAPRDVILEMAGNRDAILAETRRRWRDRDPAPLLPWLAGPAETTVPARGQRPVVRMAPAEARKFRPRRNTTV
jgi:DNA-binding HxlR family transcriptional regulator